jgi:hypothetical protein
MDLPRRGPGGWFRRLWPDRNPLRRASDRVEALIMGALLLVFLAGAPLLAIWAGRSADDSMRHLAKSQASSRYVAATLLRTVPPPQHDDFGSTGSSHARASWTGPDGQHRTGTVAAPAGARAGSKVMIWTDKSGQQAGAPLPRGQVAGQAFLAGTFAVATYGLLLICAGLLARARLDRRRLAAWDSEWQVAGPLWSSRR